MGRTNANHHVVAPPQLSVGKVIHQSARKLLSTLELHAKKDRCQSIATIPFSLPTTPVVLPAAYSLADKIVTVYDQGTVGSCTANAFCQSFNILNTVDPKFAPSRLYCYAHERMSEGQRYRLSDTGAYESDALTWARTVGVLPESLWPYVESKVNVIPPASLDKSAMSHRIKDVVQITGTGSDLLLKLKTAIAINKLPVMTAIAVYSSFMSDAVAATGVVPMPNPIHFNDENDRVDPFEGGHEVCLVGYNDANQTFVFANSWGPEWGMKAMNATTRGYFSLPAAYLTNPELAMSFYTFDSIIVVK